jgi:DNA-directed RNA polymerase specialized sigma24 family protein
MEQNHVVRDASDPPEAGGGGFPKTSWTLLGQASTGRASGNPAATNEFTERYYPAVRAYISAIVRNGTTAEELTQQFFVTAVLSGRLLLRADRAKGSFRPYLKQAIRNFLIDEHRRLARRKEESPESAVRLDSFKRGWEGLADETSHGPDTDLLRAWGQSIVRMAVARVEAISIEKGQQLHFQLFTRRFLGDSDELPGWKEVGATFNLDEKTARSRAETVVRCFRAVLWDLIATDIGSEKTFENELRNLIGIL